MDWGSFYGICKRGIDGYEKREYGMTGGNREFGLFVTGGFLFTQE